MKNKRYIQIFYLLFLVLTCRPVQAVEEYPVAMEHWASVLEEYVDPHGRIDFRRLRTQSSDLDNYIDFVSRISPDTNPSMFQTPADVIAYHINTYNALAMQGVLDRDIPDNFGSVFKRLSFFKLRKVVIGGKTTSLYDYENDLIRKLGDERVHFALNCMVRDCPRLPDTPFTGANLDQQLEKAAQEFFSREKHIRIEHDKQTVYLSEILDFYTEDFTPSGKTSDLVPYVNKYVEPDIPADYRVRFIDYDWGINQAPD